MSGGYRKALRKAIADADAAYVDNKRKAAKARAEACLYEIEAWHAQIFQGGPLYPSPTIEDAIVSGCTGVEMVCKRCNTRKTVSLDKIKRPPESLIAALDDASIDCKTCGPQRWKVRARLIGLVRESSVEPDAD